MAVDTPARIAVLGAGPIGLEAALYARYLGYDVDVYERGSVAENLRRWGHVRLFSPWRMNRSPLGVAAIATQDSGWRPPAPDTLLTGVELADKYYRPLADSDLLVDNIKTQTEVVAIGREGILKADLVGDEARGEHPFVILLRDGRGVERTATADVVIDATGTYGNHNWLGPGGIPAIGEQSFAARIEYGLPDILGRDQQEYAGRRVAVIGSGYSAATNVIALAQLAQIRSARETDASPSPASNLQPAPTDKVAKGQRGKGTEGHLKVTRHRASSSFILHPSSFISRLKPQASPIVWLTRRQSDPSSGGPIARVPQDPLTERDRVARQANELATSGKQVECRPGTVVTAIDWDAGQQTFVLKLTGNHTDSIEVDRVIANVGYRPDNRLYQELHVHECYASSGPMKLAAALLSESAHDCLSQAVRGPELLLNPEPDFYILGSKSYGRNSRFLLATGLTQIRDLFTILGDRANLDLYATSPNVS